MEVGQGNLTCHGPIIVLGSGSGGCLFFEPTSFPCIILLVAVQF